jgi:hypothetical protein
VWIVRIIKRPADTVAKINKYLKNIYVPTKIEAPIPIQKDISWKSNNNSLLLFIIKQVNGNIGQFIIVSMH